MSTPLPLDDLYTPRANIVGEIRRRQRSRLCRSTNAVEELLLTRPHAVILRNVLTPNFETLRFASIASAMGLQPIVLEFHADKFVTMNPAKAPLGLLRFAPTPQGNISECLNVQVIDPGHSNGKPFTSLTTLGGGSLIDFHHDLIGQSALRNKISHFDASAWVASQGGRAASYYQSVFKLFIAHAVLFESYLTKGRDRAFTETIVLPAFSAVTAKHNMKPLICRLDPPDSEGCDSWYHYPTSLYPHVAAQASSWAVSGNQKHLPELFLQKPGALSSQPQFAGRA